MACQNARHRLHYTMQTAYCFDFRYDFRPAVIIMWGEVLSDNFEPYCNIQAAWADRQLAACEVSW